MNKDLEACELLMMEPSPHVIKILYIEKFLESPVNNESLDKVFICMERAAPLEAKNDIDLSMKLKYIEDIVKGIIFLHSLSIVHRDLKIQNVAVVCGQAKLLDFGSSKFYGQKLEGELYATEIQSQKAINTTTFLGT